MNIEKICFQEAKRLALRSPIYWPLILNMYWKSLKSGLPAKVFRSSYFFCRHIDDVLDGDVPSSEGDPKKYVEGILQAMEGNEDGPEIVELYRFAIGHLVSMCIDGEDSEGHFRRVIEKAMLFDYQRSKDRRILTREELEQYYQDTFAPVMDLALMIAGSSLRSRDMPEAIATQGHIYSIRDLSADLSYGIINIPKEILTESGIDVARPFGKRDVMSNKRLSQWVKTELAIHHKLLKRWKRRLKDTRAKTVCLPLIHQMDLFCRLSTLGIL